MRKRTRQRRGTFESGAFEGGRGFLGFPGSGSKKKLRQLLQIQMDVDSDYDDCENSPGYSPVKVTSNTRLRSESQREMHAPTAHRPRDPRWPRQRSPSPQATHQTCMAAAARRSRRSTRRSLSWSTSCSARTRTSAARRSSSSRCGCTTGPGCLRRTSRTCPASTRSLTRFSSTRPTTRSGTRRWTRSRSTSMW